MPELNMAQLRVTTTSCLLLAVAMSFPRCSVAAEDGAALFKAKCAPCHGKSGAGQTSAKAPSLLSERVKNMSDADMRALIESRANGEREQKRMHTLQKKRLTDSEINAILAHIRELQKAK